MSPRYRSRAAKCQAGTGATWSSMYRDRTPTGGARPHFLPCGGASKGEGSVDRAPSRADLDLLYSHSDGATYSLAEVSRRLRAPGLLSIPKPAIEDAPTSGIWGADRRR